MELATFGNGCFWCTEAVFSRLKGVESVNSGYSGGNTANPTYKEVCTGTTGHAEAIQISFNPDVIAFETLLDVFFRTHDPTTLNRQGQDVGTQYRSVVFYHNEQQKNLAIGKITMLNATGNWPTPIVTEVTPAQKFYVAEDYHQGYYETHGHTPYCNLTIAPKIEKVNERFKHLLK